MTTVAVTTEVLEPFTVEELPDTLPARPQDADSLAALLSWAAAVMWPDALPPIPHRTAPGYTEDWPDAKNLFLHQLQPESDGEYAFLVSFYLLGQLAKAEATGHVEPDSDDFPGYSQGIQDPIHIRIHGQTVRLASWDYLYRPSRGKYYGDYLPDSTDLWRWSAARKGEGPASTAAADRHLPGALTTAAAMFDALAVCLSQATEPDPEPPSAPTPRRNTWR